MRVLITGVTGFIGRELARQCREAGWEVVGTSRSPAEIEGVRWRRWELRSPPDPALFDGVESIFHLAGKAHALAERRQERDEYDALIVEATGRLLDAARAAGVRRMVYFSSVKAAGMRPGLMRADDPAPPETPYGAAKRAAERLLLAQQRVEPVILRPAMVYGPTDKGNLPRMIRAIARRRFPPLPACGNRRSMIHVADVARAAMLLATHPGAAGTVFIATDGEEYAIEQITQWIYDALGRPAPRLRLPLPLLTAAASLGDAIGAVTGRRPPLDSAALDKLIGDARYDSGPLRALGFAPQRTLKEAMAEIVAFVTAGQNSSMSSDSVSPM
ncbi:MAG: NAD-dependent epimerase/dehydratase family protein [Zetaproteobacteria bacterium]|nr:MAG: NAD-dependent epimerase/dehydratase family protein [Zetaproteobacteria bacterium]